MPGRIPRTRRLNEVRAYQYVCRKGWELPEHMSSRRPAPAGLSGHMHCEACGAGTASGVLHTAGGCSIAVAWMQ